MFRLYYLDLNGKPDSAVRQRLDAGADEPDFSAKHAATARAAALQAAYRAECDVGVYRCIGGELKPAFVQHPDGRSSPPAHMETPGREECVRDTGRPCFCTPCRDERRAARATRA